MYTAKELQTRIKEIDETLAKGVQSVSVDGTTTTVSLSEMRAERDRLVKQLNQSLRPITAGIRLY